MGTVTQHITADKAGFVQHLIGLRQTFLDQSENTRDTKASRNHHRGIAEGITLAIAAVQAWKQPEVSTEELGEQIAVGVHTGLRKGSDEPSSGDLWKAINDSTDEAWGQAAHFCADGLKYMGYTITKAAE